MQVEELNNQNEWERFLQASSGATIYDSLQWREVMRRSFPAFSPLYLAIREADQKQVGMFPGFVLSFGNIKMVSLNALFKLWRPSNSRAQRARERLN